MVAWALVRSPWDEQSLHKHGAGTGTLGGRARKIPLSVHLILVFIPQLWGITCPPEEARGACMLDHGRLESGSQQVGETARRRPGNWEAGGFRRSGARCLLDPWQPPGLAGVNSAWRPKARGPDADHWLSASPPCIRGSWLASSPPLSRSEKPAKRLVLRRRKAGSAGCCRQDDLPTWRFTLFLFYLRWITLG